MQTVTVLPVLIIGLLIQLLIGSLISAVILRAACALLNKWFGKELLRSRDQPEFQPVAKPPVKSPNTQSLESQSPYAPPMAPLKQSNSGGVYARGVPEPKYGKAFLICLLASIANMVLGFALGLIVGIALRGYAQDVAIGRIAILICSTGGGFFILATGIKLGLPTSFPRALAVTGLFLLIALAVGILIGVVVGAVMLLVG